MDTNSVLKRLNINLTEFNYLRDKGIIQQLSDDQYDQSHIESLYDEHRQTIKRRYFAYITNINPSYLDDLSTPNSVYIATVFKLQATVSDIITLRLKHTEFNLELANLILKELNPSKLDGVQTITSGNHKYITLKFFSPSFAKALNNLDLLTINHVFHRHMLRAIVELKFKVNKTSKSLQATFSTPQIPNLIMNIVYSTPPTPSDNHTQVASLHTRTTQKSTHIRFKLRNDDNTLIDYLYPKIHQNDQTPYIHNQQLGEAITYFDSDY